VAVFRIERNLVGDVPLDEPLGGRNELDLVSYDVTFFDDTLVVGGVALFDIVREEIGIGASDDFLFIFEPHKVGELLVDVDEMAVGVLDEE